MKVAVTKELLTSSIARTQGAIAERSLAQIGLNATPTHLVVAATDQVLAVYSWLPATVAQPGTIFVPAKLFSDVVRELPEGVAKLHLDQSHLVIKAGKGDEFTMKLPVLLDGIWREPPTLETENAAELPASKLAYMIEQVQFCVAPDSPRNYGSVAYLHKPNSSACRLVGTDGFRLSYCEIDTPMPDCFLPNGICLSRRALTELLHMCKEGFPSVRVAISSDQTTLVAEVPDYRLFIRLSLVKYPNYMGVIPTQRMLGVLVSRDHLQSVARRVMLAADKSRALQLSFSDSSLTLNTKTIGSSEGREKVPLADYHGPRFDVAVNGKYLTDVFSIAESDGLTLHFNEEKAEDPIMIVPRREPQDCRSKHVLVPIRQAE